MGCIALFIAFLPVQKAFSFDLSHYYIAQYKHLAIQEQRLTGIPASIKLAMALLESSNGQSYLATKGNNHFGIKWWNVAFIETFDDDKDRHGKPIVSRFIRFRSVEDSYHKHSEVLKRPRYAVLFTYLITDYRSWAYGLEVCGYATARGYGSKLIQLIERYHLDQYDAFSPIVANDELGEQLEQLDADFQIAATESQSDYSFNNQLNRPFNRQLSDQPDAASTPASGYNPNFTTHNATKGTPQYKTDFEAKKVIFTSKIPISTPSKPIIESHFRNAQGQQMHFTLTEVGEEVP
jgi:hypothetical protein